MIKSMVCGLANKLLNGGTETGIRPQVQERRSLRMPHLYRPCVLAAVLLTPVHSGL